MYSHEAEVILDGIYKAYESALANYEAAAVLAEQKHLAQATSLATLALEEIGKMILLDGLLFARTGDERYKRYKQGNLSHRAKLDAMELYPLFLYYFSTVDPRQHETSYKRTLVIAITDLKAKRQKLAALFSEGFNFSDLDKLKQKGFYSTETDGVCKSNKESVDPLVSKAVLDFAWRITDTLKFVLGKHFENYRELFRKLRDNMDEATLNVIRKEATKIVTNIFGLEKEQS